MRMCVVVALLALVVMLCASQAFADRLVLTPTGSVLGRGDIRAEAAFGVSLGGGADSLFSSSDVSLYWVNVGLGQIELEGSRVDTEGSSSNIISAEAAVLPETLLNPALGVGVRDIGDEVERGYYAAVTKTVPLTDSLPLPLHDIKVHAGYGIKGMDGLFGGVQVGLPMRLTLCAEMDGDFFNAALSWNVIPLVGLKAYSLDGDMFYGASFRASF